MPRQRRVVLPGRPHHITQRGNNRRDVFFEDKDHELYLSLLSEYTAKYQVEILGYCLMTNHVHLIAVPADATGLAKAIGRVHNDYARWLHIRRRESGHLWQNRFFSCPLGMPIPGRRLPVWSETRCVLEWLRTAKNGLGAVPGSISAGRIGAIGWRYRSGRKTGRRCFGGLRSRSPPPLSLPCSSSTEN
jgi:REP element-mobilizing transposase RayT